MHGDRSRVGTFLGELKRRRVIRVAVVYAVVGWIIIQVAATTFPYLDLPSGLVTAVIVLTALGFPLAIVLSWAYDITPAGVQRTPSGQPAAPDPAARGATADAVAAGGVRTDVSEPEPPGSSPRAGAREAGAAAGRGPGGSGSDETGGKRIRLIALPFRMLRPDPETEFLAFSLPDAVTSSLSGIGSLVIRSQLAAMRYASEHPDLEEIGARAQVDVVLTGTLLRIGERIAITTQLTDVREGTLLWSDNAKTELGDLFQVQEQLADRIVGSLRLPLSDRERRLLRLDVPANARSYEFYLRANDVAYDAAQWGTARDLYLESVKADPDFAPAWARLARCYRLLAKYAATEADSARSLERAVEAFERALRLNPDLPLAQNLYAQLEVDLGRAEEAMVRLLGQLRHHSSEAQFYAGLVHACRFVGLLDASVAAHEAARRLDPETPTSVSHTFWMRGDYERVLEHTYGDIGYVAGVALAALGRDAEAIEILRENEAGAKEPRIRAYIASLRSVLEDDRKATLDALDVACGFRQDGEALYYMARTFARLGEAERAVQELKQVVKLGFVCAPLFDRDPWLDAVRADSRFVALAAEARERHERAAARYEAAGGPELLGSAGLTSYTAPT